MESFISDMITKYVENMLNVEVRQKIIDAGLNKWVYEKFDKQYALSDPNIFNGRAFAKKILFVGLSDYIINNLSYTMHNSKITIDISIPKVLISMADAGLDITFFGSPFIGKLKGSVAVVEPRISGEAEIVEENGTYNVTGLKIKFNLKKITSNVSCNFQGVNYSNLINNYLGIKLPVYINDNQEQISQILEAIIMKGIENSKK